VIGSLLEKFGGKIDLIYIDPPFATGADFSFEAPVGETEVTIGKEASILRGEGLQKYVGARIGIIYADAV
jgi:hypothetical protein